MINKKLTLNQVIFMKEILLNNKFNEKDIIIR